MKKRKAAAPYISVPRTNHFPETGNQDPVYRQWLIDICRIIVKFIAEKAQHSRESPDEQRKTPLTITEQINLLDQLQRTGAGGDRGYGNYLQQPVRYRANVDHLVRRKEVNEELCDINGPKDQSDDPST